MKPINKDDLCLDLELLIKQDCNGRVVKSIQENLDCSIPSTTNRLDLYLKSVGAAMRIVDKVWQSHHK